jgi:hypothetical protein
VAPQQFLDSWGFLRNTGVAPVFYTPTYNPCTPCGPACWTAAPGSTSPQQCGGWLLGKRAEGGQRGSLPAWTS